MDEPLDIFGQNPRLSRLYTQLCFCFSLPDVSPSSHSAITTLLQIGLQRLSESFPWTAGQVTQTRDGLYKITAYEKTPQLIVRDYTSDFPSMTELEEAGFPFSMIDEAVIAPRKTLPERCEESAPVFLVQVNVVAGGVLVVFCGQHNCMDMTGQCQVIGLFARACRGEDFCGKEVSIGGLGVLKVGKEEGERPFAKEGGRRGDEEVPPSAKEVPPATVPKSTWAYIIFSSASLARLKALATADDITTDFISTDDVLSAFIWQSVTRARLPRLHATATTTATTTTFDRQVDARNALGMPQTYTGNVVHKVTCTFAIENLVEATLGAVSSHLRSALIPESDIAYQIRLAATTASRNLGRNLSGTTQRVNALPSMDVKMSSWAKEKCHDFDFGGVLGKASAVRRPAFEAWEGLAYLMPKGADGTIAAAACLREEDLERLRADEEFGRFGKWVG